MSKLLLSLKIYDPDNTISLTNIAVMVLIVKIALASTLDWPTTASLLLALVSYGHKRQLNAKRAASAETTNKSMQDLEQKVQELFTVMNIKRLK